MFKRDIHEEIIKQLQKSDIYQKKILKDIKTGVILPCIRDERIDFYYGGGNLFTFDKKGFATHIKYASVYKYKGKDPYVSESEIQKMEKITSFLDGYERIKENCSLYAGDEAISISDIYRRYSYILPRNIVVLDIEISLKSLKNDGSKQDRIDILFFDRKKERLIFCEGKHYSNGELWSEKGTEPKVVKQIRRYEEQIIDKQDSILNGYCNYISIVNNLFSLDLPCPGSISKNVLLIVTGFDKDQSSGRLTNLFKENMPNDLKYYPVGSPANFKPENMLEQCGL